MRRICQIVPGYSKSSNALYDYSRLLSAKFVATKILSVEYLAMSQMVENAFIILHYSGYGYSRYGSPYKLLKWISRLKQKNQIIIIFHELYASSTDYRSLTFYTSFFQQHIFQKFLRLADGVYTTNERMLRLIKQSINTNVNVELLPVISNIPYCDNGEIQRRSSDAILFGTAGSRLNILRNAKKLREFLELNNVDRLISVGERIDSNELIKPSIKLIHTGFLQPEDVSLFMQKARYGLVFYPSSLMAKSGVINAFFNHSMCVVNFHEELNNEADGLCMGTHFTAVSMISETVSNNVATNGNKWYKQRLSIFNNQLELMIQKCLSQ